MAAEKLDTEIRQEQIAQAALSLLATHGLKGLSVGAVARRIGLVPSAIYRHFKNKEQMLDAALDFIRSKVFENFKAVCEQVSDPLDRLERLLLLNVRMIREFQAMPRIVFSEGFYSGYPGRKAKAYAMVRGYLNKVEEIIRQGQQEGRIRPDLDPATVSVMFWGMLPPVAILWHVSDGRFDVTKQTERAWRIFREAIQRATEIAPSEKPAAVRGREKEEN